jgi:hypothetical protein
LDIRMAEMDRTPPRDEQYGSTLLIDVAAVPLSELAEMESAALRAAVASCIGDDKESIASFSNSI